MNELSGRVVKRFGVFLRVRLSWRVISCNNVLEHVYRSKAYRVKRSLQVYDTGRR